MDPEDAMLRANRAAEYRAEREREHDAELGIEWWNELTEAKRAEWKRRANSAAPADAWEAYKQSLG